MLTVAYEKTNENYGRWIVVRQIDEETLCRAIEIFEDYKKCGIILNDSFNDSIWTLSNQIKNVGLMLIAFEGSYHNKARDWLGCDYRCYQDCVKAYIAFNLGKMELSSLQEIAKIFVSLTKKTSEEVADTREFINHVMGLLQLIPGYSEKRDWVIETLEEKAERNQNHRKGNQRCLADFKTYLKFNDIITQFWEIADDRQKLFYFPLYFWWNLTSILPLRPTEFLLTPRDCLEVDDNGDGILTIRRTKLKGGLEKITYRVEGDYMRKKYSINENLVAPLRSYLKATENMRQTEVNTLFLQEPHYNYFGVSPNLLSKYYSYANLNTCLRYFYQEVVQQKNAELALIHLGDTRHIAMANLIISGGSPVICKELAGHSDIDISSHYYSNISNLVECVTLERYRKSMGCKAEIIGTSKFPITNLESWYRLPSGWCDAASVKEGDIGECIKITNMQGEIGNCNHCGHYHCDEPGIRLNFLDEKVGKWKVDADSQYLMRMIELVRKGIGNTEGIGAALIRLQHSSDHYSKCLWEKYSNGNGGKKLWEDQKS